MHLYNNMDRSRTRYAPPRTTPPCQKLPLPFENSPQASAIGCRPHPDPLALCFIGRQYGRSGRPIRSPFENPNEESIEAVSCALKLAEAIIFQKDALLGAAQVISGSDVPAPLVSDAIRYTLAKERISIVLTDELYPAPFGWHLRPRPDESVEEIANKKSSVFVNSWVSFFRYLLSS